MEIWVLNLIIDDTQVMKFEKKRGSKNERLKKLSAQLREIAQNTE